MVFLGIAASEWLTAVVRSLGAPARGVRHWRTSFGSFLGARVAGHAPEDETHLWPRFHHRQRANSAMVELAFIAIFTVVVASSCTAPRRSSDISYAPIRDSTPRLSGFQSSAVLRFGLSGLLSSDVPNGNADTVRRQLHEEGRARLQARSGSNPLALIVGAGLGALCALYAPIMIAPIVPLGALCRRRLWRIEFISPSSLVTQDNPRWIARAN